MKKIFLILVFSILLICILPFFLCPLLDDIVLIKYRSEISKTLNNELPDDVVIMEIVSGCGNTGGTGNHTDLYVSVLVTAPFSETEWETIGYEPHSVSKEGSSTFSMDLLHLSFSEITDPDHSYILEFVREAPFSFFDLRGN
mgnify:FL=1